MARQCVSSVRAPLQAQYRLSGSMQGIARMHMASRQVPPAFLSRVLACAQVLYFAEFDLQFFKTRSEMLRHLGKCRLQHPPGDEIYRNRTAKGSVSMYEVRALQGFWAAEPLCAACLHGLGKH